MDNCHKLQPFKRNFLETIVRLFCLVFAGPHLLHRSRLRTGGRACPGRGWCRRRCYGRHSGTPPVDSVAESDKSDKSEKFADLEHEDLNRLSHVMNASQAALLRSLVTSIFLGGHSAPLLHLVLQNAERCCGRHRLEEFITMYK